MSISWYKRCVYVGTLLAGLLAVSSQAVANDCDPTTSTGGCTPQSIRVELSPTGGLRVLWAIFDDPLPNSVTITKAPHPNFACNKPTGAPTTITVPPETSLYDDTKVTPGGFYSYSVCLQWDSGDSCAAPVCQGLNPGPPPGGGGSGGGGGGTSGPPTYARNLKIQESTYPIGGNVVHFFRRWSWSWDRGNSGYGKIYRRQNVSGQWQVIGDPLDPTSSSFVEDLDLHRVPTGDYSICQGPNPSNFESCSNAFHLEGKPFPTPWWPINTAARMHHGDVEITFSSGDDNASVGFLAEGLKGNDWSLIGDTLLGPPGLIIDRNRGSSGIYRVCATNQSGRACTNEFKLPVPKAPVHTAAFSREEKVDIVFTSGDEDLSEWFEVERLNGLDKWLVIAPQVPFGFPGKVSDHRESSQPGFKDPYTYRVCAGNRSGRTCSPPFKARIVFEERIRPPTLSSLNVVMTDGTFPNLCLDTKDGNSTNGTPVILTQCTGTPSQLWNRPEGSVLDHLLENKPASRITGIGGKCLDVTAFHSTNGTPIQLWDCLGPHQLGGANQLWKLEDDGNIKGFADKCIGVRIGDLPFNEPIVLVDCTGFGYHHWSIRSK